MVMGNQVYGAEEVITNVICVYNRHHKKNNLRACTGFDRSLEERKACRGWWTPRKSDTKQ